MEVTDASGNAPVSLSPAVHAQTPKVKTAYIVNLMAFPAYRAQAQT